MKLILDYKDRFLQKKHRFDSIDVKRFIDFLDQEVEITNFHKYLNEKQNDSEIVVFTSSQVEQYKKYIEDSMYFCNAKIQVPTYEVLRSHENKFFQELYNRKYEIKTNIKSYLIGDISEYDKMVEQKKLPLPLVVKGINGSSSMNVCICRTYEEGRSAILVMYKQLVDAYNEITPQNLDLYPGENSFHRQVVIQEYINLPNYDYRVHIMGSKYWGHKRTLKDDSEYVSGNGSVNDYLCEIPEHVLNFSEEVFSKIDSPFAILDVVDVDGKCYLIEWSGIQLGIVSLLNGKRYYKKEVSRWVRHEQIADVEYEFASSINEYIKEKKNEA